MVKKVKAPKTYNPGKGRPKEYLAYLNEREMAYLRAFNGNNMERGPRGLPSFAEESVAGPGGNKGGGGGSGASGGSSSGTGGQGASTNSASSSPSQAKTFDRSQTMMTDANGVSYDYDGNVVKTASNPQKSNSFASPNFPSTTNLDRQVQNQTQVKDAIQTVKNAPAVKNDLAAGGVRSINVGPMGTSVSVKGPQAVSSPVSKPPEAKIGMSAPKGFYDGITAAQENMLRGVQRQEERVSSGLLGRSVNDPRDTVSVPSRTATSSGVTPGERQAAWDSINPAKIASGIYNDPAGTASRVASGISSGIQSLGGYMRDTYNTIGRGAFSSDPMEREAAAQSAAEAAVNFGVLGGPAGAIAAPKNSLGMWAGRMSQDPAVQKALDLGEDLRRKGARPEDIFNETVKQSPSYMSGVMTLPFSQQRQMVELAQSLELKRANPIDTVVRTFTGDRRPLGSIIKEDSPLLKSYPDLADMPIGGSLLDISDERGVLRGMYNPGVAGTSIREAININYPQADSLLSDAMIKAKGLMSRGDAEAITGSNFKHTLGHELGHAVAKREGFPSGTNPDAIAERIVSKSPSMPKSEVQDLAWENYLNTPGEYYARQIADRLGLPPEEIRSYLRNFVNAISPEDYRKMKKSVDWQNSQWHP